jgi:hypothetical protein
MDNCSIDDGFSASNRAQVMMMLASADAAENAWRRYEAPTPAAWASFR